MSTADFNRKKDVGDFLAQNETKNILEKFKTYRLDAETRERQLEEAQAVVNQLKAEANLSRDVEKNLIFQMSSAQKRLTQLQSTLKKFIVIADKQKQVEKTSQRIEQRLEELNKLVKETEAQARNLRERITREVNITKKNEYLKSNLAAKNSELDSMKADIESLMEEKLEMKSEFELKVKRLEEELEKEKGENAELKCYCDETLSEYKRQIEDNGKRIREYERERKTFLEDFELPKKPDGNPELIWADSTVSINPEERPNIESREREAKDDEADLFCPSPSIVQRRKPKSSSSQKGRREKPQLSFLTQSQSSVRETPNSQRAPAKRKLFSTNFNHYIN